MISADDAFAAWVAFRGPIEGVISLDPNDPGNYRSGRIGDGPVVGTKYGISAAAYPTLNIADLTEDDANTIARRDFWPAMLSPPVAFMVMDMDFNSGNVPGRETLQGILGVRQDGNIGPVTLAALDVYLANHGITSLLTEYAVQRIVFMSKLGNTWLTNRLGWLRRVFSALAAAQKLG